jgi:hypothetical protein
MTWLVQCYPSGTMVVVKAGGPWLYVYGPGGENEEQYNANRRQCCKDLANFLNGGDRPAWLNDLRRHSEDYASDLDGTSIAATGPMYDADPPKLLWKQDESQEAKDARARLMDRLFLDHAAVRG